MARKGYAVSDRGGLRLRDVNNARPGGRREGIGFSTVSADHAVRSSCFYGRYRIVERAVVWSPIRRGWFAVIRYE